MKITIGSSVAICAFVYELIGIIGYVVFGAAVKGVILSNCNFFFSNMVESRI